VGKIVEAANFAHVGKRRSHPPVMRRRPLRRAPWRRRPPDAPRARGRQAVSPAEWQAIRATVLARAGWCCEACAAPGRLDVHHVVKRSQGGADTELDALVALCRRCHERTDAPYARGRLVIRARGAGRFTFDIIQRPGKNKVAT
jgi:5-methylcytosine-specific restriction endonuclease McrA